MNFDLTRFGLIGAGNANKIQQKTDFTKANKAEQAEEVVAAEAKKADASALDLAATQNLGFVRSAEAKAVTGETAQELTALFAMAGINHRMPTEKEYARIAHSSAKAMDDVVAVGTAANAEASLARFEQLFG